MNLKYTLLITMFFVFTPLMAGDAIDADVPFVSTSDEVVTVQQDEPEISADEEKRTVFEKVQKELIPYGIVLNRSAIIRQNTLDLSGQLAGHRQDIQEIILTKICEFPWLQKLHLSYNQLRALPPQIGLLIQLTKLELIDNELTALPPQIEALTQLEELYLYQNQLTALPPQIGALTQLKYFSLSDNQLTALPLEIAALTQLRRLYIFKNQLMTIPARIGEIQTLETLSLSENPLLLPIGETPDQWGRQELNEHLGDRVMLDDLGILECMPGTTTAGQVYQILDEQPLCVNREYFTVLRLPTIQVKSVFSSDEMLETLAQIIRKLNLTDEQGEAYLSYEELTNNFTHHVNSDENQTTTAAPLTNAEKIKTYLIPRLTGYIRGLYGVPLAPTDIRPWTMYEDQILETQKVLTYVFTQIRDAGDADSQALLFYQLVNGLLHCPTGQAEGINAVAYALAEGAYRVNDFVGRISHHLAVKKNTAFTQSILMKGANSTQNRHLISFYRGLLNKILGLTAAISSFTERMGTGGTDPFSRNRWNVVQVFYDLVTPHRLLDWVMDICETAEDKQNQQALRKQEEALAKLNTLANFDARIGLLESILMDDTLDAARVIELQKKRDETRAQKEMALRAISLSAMSSSSTSTTTCENEGKGEMSEALRKELAQQYQQEIQKLKAAIKKNSQFRFLTTGLTCTYLSDQRFIGDEDCWKAYFTTDPVIDESALITRDGMMNILVHMGLVIRS